MTEGRFFDFDADRRARAASAEPMVARVGGRDIHWRPTVPVIPAKAIVERIAAAEASGNDLALTVAVVDYLAIVVHPDSAEDLADVILSTADPIDAADLARLYVWVCAEHERRNTPEPKAAPALPPPADPAAPAARRTSLDELQSILGRRAPGRPTGSDRA